MNGLEMEWKVFGEDKADNEGRTSHGKDGEIYRSIEQADGTGFHWRSNEEIVTYTHN